MRSLGYEHSTYEHPVDAGKHLGDPWDDCGGLAAAELQVSSAKCAGVTFMYFPSSTSNPSHITQGLGHAEQAHPLIHCH